MPTNSQKLELFNDLAEKQIRVLMASVKVSQYEKRLDCQVDLATCSNDIFNRHMISRSRIDRARVKICKAAAFYNVSALRRLSINIGNRFLTYSVWAGFDCVPFTEEDKQNLRRYKDTSISTLLKALAACKLVLYASEVLISGSYLNCDAVRSVQKCSPLLVRECVAKSTWIDIEALPVEYSSKEVLDASFNPNTRFHCTPAPEDNLQIQTLRINLYENFDQRLCSFAPIPFKVFAIFLITPIRPADPV